MKKLIIGGLAALSIGLVGCGAATTDTSLSAIGQTPAAATAVVTTETPAPPTEQELLVAWGAKVSPILDSMQTNLTSTATAGENEDLPGMRNGCSAFSDDLADLEAILPSPNPEVTTELQGAADDYQAMTVICKGLRLDSSLESDAAEMAAYMESGNAHMEAATEILKTVLA